MFAVSLIVTAAWVALGQAEEAKTEKVEPAEAPKASQKAIEDFKQDFREYVIRLDSRPKEKLALRDEPLLHWENPARNGEDGAVFVWMLNGRPEVIGTVFTHRSRNLIRRKHMYHSLASEGLTAVYREQKVWGPRKPGVTFRPIPDAPEPAGTPRLRLTQMKGLARDFTARMEDLKGERTELRLVPQPVIRYEPKNQATTDGAIFSFAVGTDPEALLLIEARTEKGRSTWQYAFARFHFIDLWAWHKETEVWHAEPLRDILNVELGSLKYQENEYASYLVSSKEAE